MDASLVNSVGLLLDIVGACLLWKYGLPEHINRHGHGALLIEQDDEEEIAKGRIYDYRSRWGLALLVTGFVLQLVSNFIR